MGDISLTEGECSRKGHLKHHSLRGLKTSSEQPNAYLRQRVISSCTVRLSPSLKSGPVYVTYRPMKPLTFDMHAPHAQLSSDCMLSRWYHTLSIDTLNGIGRLLLALQQACSACFSAGKPAAIMRLSLSVMTTRVAGKEPY